MSTIIIILSSIAMFLGFLFWGFVSIRLYYALKHGVDSVNLWNSFIGIFQICPYVPFLLSLACLALTAAGLISLAFKI